MIHHVFQRSDLGCNSQKQRQADTLYKSLPATNVCAPFVWARAQHNHSDQGIEKFLHDRVDLGITLVAVIGGAATGQLVAETPLSIKLSVPLTCQLQTWLEHHGIAAVEMDIRQGYCVQVAEIWIPVRRPLHATRKKVNNSKLLPRMTSLPKNKTKRRPATHAPTRGKGTREEPWAVMPVLTMLWMKGYLVTCSLRLASEYCSLRLASECCSH